MQIPLWLVLILVSMIGVDVCKGCIRYGVRLLVTYAMSWCMVVWQPSAPVGLDHAPFFNHTHGWNDSKHEEHYHNRRHPSKLMQLNVYIYIYIFDVRICHNDSKYSSIQVIVTHCCSCCCFFFLFHSCILVDVGVNLELLIINRLLTHYADRLVISYKQHLNQFNTQIQGSVSKTKWQFARLERSGSVMRYFKMIRGWKYGKLAGINLWLIIVYQWEQ